MHDFLNALRQSLDDGSFISLTLSKPAGAPHDQRAERVTVRPVDIRGQRRWQWTTHLSRQQLHDNLEAHEFLERLERSLTGTFRHAHLFTSEADISVRIDKSGQLRMKSHPPTKQSAREPQHDRQKAYLIPEGQPCPFLHELGVMTADGRVHRSRRDKYRQINRFLEFVQDIVPHLPTTGPLQVVDFGCGLSYLTFALHHLLTVVHQREVNILGVDQNPQVIQRCIQTSRSLELRGLKFVNQAITAPLPWSKIHLAVALHACDTATDEALAQAIHGQADAILAAPCCQHELAPQLDSDPLSLLTQHGILRERLAAMATDALRAALLEQAGYRTQIIEFIDTEHTPKNLLIRATRRTTPAPASDLSVRIAGLTSLLGIKHHRLAHLLEYRMPNTEC